MKQRDASHGFLGVSTDEQSDARPADGGVVIVDRTDDMSTRTTPQDGDIVIRQERREGTLVYVLHTAPGPDQYVLRSRDKGIAQAVTVAKREHVRAWLTDEGYDFQLLEDFRAVELL